MTDQAAPPDQSFELPAIHTAVAETSRRGQRLYLQLTGLELALLVAAAIAGGLAAWAGLSENQLDNMVRVLGAVLAGIFIAGVLVKNLGFQRNPEQKWFDGRVGAESVKTLSWRYAVGGQPFPKRGPSSRECDQLFVERMDDIIDSIDGLPATPATGHQITEDMRQARGQHLADRQQLYEQARIAHQQAWYNEKSAWNAQRSRRLGNAAFALEVAGLGIGLVMVLASGLSAEVWIGPIATIAAGITAWSHSRQHSLLSSSYARAALELTSIRTKLAHRLDEDEWAGFVADAEEAISREHTSWQATRMT